MVFGQKLKNLTLANKDTIGKSISKGAEWHKFELRSTFQRGVTSVQAFSKSTAVTTFTIRIHLNGREVSLAINHTPPPPPPPPPPLYTPQEEATESIISLIEHHQSSASKDKDVATVIGLNTLGKEDLLVTIACRLKQWVGVSKERYESLKLLELPDVFCTDSSECHVQVHRAYLVSRGM